MAYSTDISKTLAAQLYKFATLHCHQLAGQAGNLDFWIDECRHCFAVLDKYKSRFERMKSAQLKYVSEHNTVEYDFRESCPCCKHEVPVPPPKRIDSREITETRQSLCEAMYRFLRRCYHESVIDEPTFMQTLNQLGISYDPADLR
jgi:hypothetical protein